MKAFLLAAALAAFALQLRAAPAPPPDDSYASRPEVRAFIHDMAERHGFVERELVYLFSRVRRADPVLRAIQPHEQPHSWHDFRAMFVNARRIDGGLAFWKMHASALERAEREYGVPAEYIVAIIGIETLYGRNAGRWRVIDALSTLAFDYPPRASFFREQLAQYLLLARDEDMDVFSTLGSYAGAFGIPQFMPGSARRYAVDFDGSGTIDLRESPVDALGSVANFLARHGWQRGGEVLLPARAEGDSVRRYVSSDMRPRQTAAQLVAAGAVVDDLPERLAAEPAALIELETPGEPSEYRIGFQNFYALTRYNRSAFYASAADELARRLKQARAQGAGR
jgi:membrane-bound lytic murein transglycosylase B